MKDPERLATTGSDEHRALLRAARAVNVPAAVQDEVRRAVEAEIAERAPRKRRRKLLGLGAGGVLIAATAAAAQGLGGFERLWQALDGDERRAHTAEPEDGFAHRTAPARSPVPDPAAVAVPPSPGEAAAPRRPAQAQPTPPPHAPTEPVPAGPREQPGLDLTGFRRGFSQPAGAAPPAPVAPPPAAAGSLVIGRAGRGDVVLSAAGDRLRGQVRGVPVDLHITARRITGRIGGDEALIWIFGNRRADGTVGGRALSFTFNPTRQGWIAGGALPDIGARVELDPGKLSFLPGCDRPLAAVATSPGRYQGTCADGTAARIDLPAPFLALPPLSQMVVLGMLLPERDPVLPEEERPLFPRP